MNRLLFFIIATFTFLLAVEQEVEVYTKGVKKEGDKAIITDGVIVSYDKKILKAKEAIFFMDKNLLILKRDVIIFDELGRKINADEVEVNLDSSNIKFKNLFEIDKDDVWIFALSGEKQDNITTLNNAVFSSCEIDNPDWSIHFNRAKYDLKAKELKLKGATLRVKDFPLLYTPYFYLPLSKERRTGFLFPIFSYDKTEGFSYAQPFFWAINQRTDLEIVPIVKTNRGSGLFLTYRFVDSNHSSGKIRVGYFEDDSSFTQEHSLKYQKHYGIELLYRNDSIVPRLSSLGYENKLYINGAFFRDFDYINLQPYDKLKHHELGQFYESRLNFYFKGSSFYSGAYFKYFKDTTADSNKETLQIAPKLHFHMPVSNLIYNNLSYSLDASVTNFTRDSGTKAFKAKIKTPLDLHFSLFGGYLNLNISSELDATGYDFYNVPIEQKKYSSVVFNSTVELSNEMVKIYEAGTHISFFSATYTKSSIVSEDWMRYEDIPDGLKRDFVDDIPFESKITFRTHQDWKGKNLSIKYILESHYHPKESEFRDLDQEIDIKYKSFFFYSKFGYSFLYKKTTDIFNRVGYSSDKFDLALGFLWKKDPLSFETTTKEVSLTTKYNYKNNLKFNAKVAYNMNDKNLKNWETGAYYKRKCWSVNVAVGQDIKPVIKSDGSRGSIKNNYVKFYLSVLPFGVGIKNNGD